MAEEAPEAMSCVAVAYGAVDVARVYMAVIREETGDSGSDLSPQSLASSFAAGRLAERTMSELGLGTSPGALVRSMIAEIGILETGSAEATGSTYRVTMDSARFPSSPSSLNVHPMLMIDGLISLAAGIVYAVLRYTLDRRVRSVDGVEHATGLVVVGTDLEDKSFAAGRRLVPFDGGNSGNSSKEHLFGIAKSMCELRCNVQVIDVDNPPRVIVVSGLLLGDGNPTTASNPAITLVTNGQRTILINGDLRWPVVSNVLANQADGANVVTTVGKTTYEVLGKALVNLERARAHLVGVVLAADLPMIVVADALDEVRDASFEPSAPSCAEPRHGGKGGPSCA